MERKEVADSDGEVCWGSPQITLAVCVLFHFLIVELMENEVSFTIAHGVRSTGNRQAVGSEEGRVRVQRDRRRGGGGGGGAHQPSSMGRNHRIEGWNPEEQQDPSYLNQTRPWTFEERKNVLEMGQGGCSRGVLWMVCWAKDLEFGFLIKTFFERGEFELFYNSFITSLSIIPFPVGGGLS